MNKFTILTASAAFLALASCAIEGQGDYDKAIRYLINAGDDEIARDLNTEYRSGDPQKAFYISDSGIGYTWGYPTMAEAKQDAKSECDAASNAGDICVPFMINDSFVYVE